MEDLKVVEWAEQRMKVGTVHGMMQKEAMLVANGEGMPYNTNQRKRKETLVQS